MYSEQNGHFVGASSFEGNRLGETPFHNSELATSSEVPPQTDEAFLILCEYQPRIKEMFEELQQIDSASAHAFKVAAVKDRTNAEASFERFVHPYVEERPSRKAGKRPSAATRKPKAAPT